MIALQDPQDFEATTPNDADNNNVFEIIYKEDDGGSADDALAKLSTSTPTISITVVNDNDPPYFPSEDSGQFPSTAVFNEDEPFQFISPANFGVGDPDVSDTGADEITVTLKSSEQMAQFKSLIDLLSHQAATTLNFSPSEGTQLH